MGLIAIAIAIATATATATATSAASQRRQHHHLCPVFPILFLVLLASDLSGSRSESVGDDGCQGRWIHIRKLPTRFNLDLLETCADYAIYRDFCTYVTNHGLGPKTHNRSHSWYRTDPHMLELVFHRRMLEWPCLTPDADAADAVYLPYYAGIDALKYLYGPEVNSSADHGLDLYDFLAAEEPAVWERRRGHDHFLVMARPAWDFSQPLTNDPPIWGTSFLELPEFYNVTALTLESRPWPWQETAVPYPTSFHPPSLARLDAWLSRARRARRTSLMLFAGGGGTSSFPNIRHSIRAECANATNNCDFVDCSKGVCEHDPIRYTRPMLKASFCLQPPGDTPTRRSTFDAMIAGCIPVFFEEQSARSQFRWHLPEDIYEEFSVYIPKEEVVVNGLRIAEVLRSISKEREREMRERVLELATRVTYRRHGSSVVLRSTKDAFDVAVEGALRRIKYKLRLVDTR